MGEKTIKINECFIKYYDENSDKRYFLAVDIDYPRNLFNFHKYLSFLAERKKTENVISLFVPYTTKKNYVVHIKALK